MADAVLFELKGNVAWITLNRPGSLNAVNEEMVDRLLELFAAVKKDPAARVAVLTGAGRAFSAGGDIYEMAAVQGEEVRGFQHKIQTLCWVMRDLDKPILAAVNGHALGAGIELALMCDLRIGSQAAVFGIPDALLGISPGGGMTYLLPRVIGMGRSMHLALDCEVINAKEARRIGLITQVEAPDNLLDAVQALAARMASYPEKGLAYMKRAYYMAAEGAFAATLKLEEEYDLGSFRSAETQRELQAFLENRSKKQAAKRGSA